VGDLDRLGDEIAALSAHLDAATARLLALLREFDARGGWATGFRSERWARAPRPGRYETRQGAGDDRDMTGDRGRVRVCWAKPMPIIHHRALRLRAVGLLALGLVLATGCAPRLGRPVDDPAGALQPVPAWRMPTLRDDGDRASLRAALAQSRAWLATAPPDRLLTFGSRQVPAGRLAQALARLDDYLASDPTPEQLAGWLGEAFEVLESVGGEDGAVLVTGYYEPVVEAAEQPGGEYRVPILGIPDDLVEAALDAFDPRWRGERIAGRLEGRRLVPYWSRAEIDGGRLAGRGVELAWARDPVDAFFLEIQGSGTLRLPDGREMRVGYAASNGRPYRPIGRLLIDEGKLTREAMSMQTLRAWLAAHPEERARILHYNESVVFFRRLHGPPLGFLGVPVTAGRSIATDHRLFPPAALAFLRTDRPRLRSEQPRPGTEQPRPGTGRPGLGAGGPVEWVPLGRLVLNQDTGGAMRGPGRVDVFWGRGPDAELAAGLMKQRGRLYFLVPRP
jgi:membrane-bound lytic murein transglycosylase A